MASVDITQEFKKYIERHPGRTIRIERSYRDEYDPDMKDAYLEEVFVIMENGEKILVPKNSMFPE